MRIDQSEIAAILRRIEGCEQRIAREHVQIDRLAAMGAPTDIEDQMLRAMLVALDATETRLAALLSNSKPRASSN